MSAFEDRLEAIELLLRSLHDYDYEPETSTGNLVRRRAKPGEGPSRKVLCPTCNGDKVRRIRGIPTPCELCLSPKTGKPLGWIYVDGNVNEPFQRKIGSEEGGLVSRARWVRCDAGCSRGLHGNGQNCRHCSDSGRPGYVRAPAEIIRFRASGVTVEVELQVGGGDPILDCWERRRLAGSFEELVIALDELRGRWSIGYRLLEITYISGAREPSALPEALQRRLDTALRFLERKMPLEIRVPPSARRNERRRRERRRGNGIAA